MLSVCRMPEPVPGGLQAAHSGDHRGDPARSGGKRCGAAAAAEEPGAVHEELQQPLPGTAAGAPGLDPAFQKGQNPHQKYQQGTGRGPVLRGMYRGVQQNGPCGPPGNGADFQETGDRLRDPGRERGVLRIHCHARRRRGRVQTGGHRKSYNVQKTPRREGDEYHRDLLRRMFQGHQEGLHSVFGIR